MTQSGTPERPPHPKERDFNVDATELELERRRPEPPPETASAIAARKESAALLSGIMVDAGMTDMTGVDEAVLLEAARTVRVYNNQHDCPQVHGGECTHPDHWRDAARLRGDLLKLGLPGTADFRPLEDSRGDNG